MEPQGQSGSKILLEIWFEWPVRNANNLGSRLLCSQTDGQVIKTRGGARKSAAGFDTTKLFIGAEGTLGIVTESVHHCGFNKHFL